LPDGAGRTEDGEAFQRSLKSNGYSSSSHFRSAAV
jgi:hypothetical protein